MQVSTQRDETVAIAIESLPSLDLSEQPLQRPRADSLAEYRVIRRNGMVVGFEPNKILVAMSKAFIAVRGGQGAASAAIREQVEALTNLAVAALVRRQPAGGTFHIEDIQDQVELSLMRAGAHDVARAYVLYRERRAQERAQERAQLREAQAAEAGELTVVDGERRFALDRSALTALIQAACDGLGQGVSAQAVLTQTLRNLYDGVPLAEVHKSAILAARGLIESDPDYGRVSARLLLHSVRREVLGEEVGQAAMSAWAGSIWPGWRGRCAPSATCNLLIWGCRRCTTATFCTTRGAASSCPRPSSCGSPWAWPSTRPTAKPGPSSSTRCCRVSTSCARPRPCSTRAPATPSCHPVTWPRSRTTWRRSTRRSRKTRCSPSMRAVWATTGLRCARSARTFGAPTASPRGSCRS